MGDSGGAGIAAGAAILARDRGVPLAKQILIYPMLDDRTVACDDELDGLAHVWFAGEQQDGLGGRAGRAPGNR